MEITSQNHGFAVAEDTLPKFLQVTHRSLNDGTIEGFTHLDVPAYSVQYHPEASAGPHDSHYLFQRFLGLDALNRAVEDVEPLLPLSRRSSKKSIFSRDKTLLTH